jgi:hypothetical protein
MRITFCAYTIGEENIVRHVTSIVTGEYGSEWLLTIKFAVTGCSTATAIQ